MLVAGLGEQPAVGFVGPVPAAVEGSSEAAGFGEAAEAVEAAAVVAAVVAVVAVLLDFVADPVVSVLVAAAAASELAVDYGGQPQWPDRHQSISVLVLSLVLETQAGSEAGSQLAVEQYAVAAVAVAVAAGHFAVAGPVGLEHGRPVLGLELAVVGSAVVAAEQFADSVAVPVDVVVVAAAAAAAVDAAAVDAI